MSILITFLTLVLVLNSVILILLVLIQLPKKEAGAGLAFGAGTTDALFGAGSGNALTKLTKYASVTFLGLALVLGLLNARVAHATTSTLREKLAAQKPGTAAPVAAPVAPANPFSPIPGGTNALMTTVSTSAPATTVTTNVAAATNAVSNAAKAIPAPTNNAATTNK